MMTDDDEKFKKKLIVLLTVVEGVVSIVTNVHNKCVVVLAHLYMILHWGLCSVRLLSS